MQTTKFSLTSFSLTRSLVQKLVMPAFEQGSLSRKTWSYVRGFNELSHMGRLDNGVTHNAVNFYHCFKMWVSEEKKNTLLACITLNLPKLFIITHAFPLRGSPLTSKIGQFGKERRSREGKEK